MILESSLLFSGMTLHLTWQWIACFFPFWRILVWNLQHHKWLWDQYVYCTCTLDQYTCSFGYSFGIFINGNALWSLSFRFSSTSFSQKFENFLFRTTLVLPHKNNFHSPKCCSVTQFFCGYFPFIVIGWWVLIFENLVPIRRKYNANPEKN